MRLPVPPARLTVFAGHSAATAYAHERTHWPSHVRADDPAIASAAAHWLHGVRVAETMADALADIGLRLRGEVIVTREGHLVGANSITWFAPDEAVHGAMGAQRSSPKSRPSRATRKLLPARPRRLLPADKRYQDLRVQATQQRGAIVGVQRRVHNLEVERLQIEQARAQATERTKQISDELSRDWRNPSPPSRSDVQSHVKRLRLPTKSGRCPRRPRDQARRAQ